MTAPTDAREAERLAKSAMELVWAVAQGEPHSVKECCDTITGLVVALRAFSLRPGAQTVETSALSALLAWRRAKSVEAAHAFASSLTPEKRREIRAAEDALWDAACALAALAHPRGEPARAEGTGAVVEAAAKAGWNACRRSIYAVCEDVMEQNGKHVEDVENEVRYHFGRGGVSAAKSIARGFGAMEANDDDNFTAALAKLAARLDAAPSDGRASGGNA